jgi:hypothetical protein
VHDPRKPEDETNPARDLASGAKPTALLQKDSTAKSDLPNRCGENGSNFSETIQTVPKPNQGPLSRQIQKSSSSNCSKLVEPIFQHQKEHNMSEGELMSFVDVSKEANLPLSTVYYLHRKGKGPETVKIGRHLRVTRNDFDLWLDRNRNK